MKEVLRHAASAAAGAAAVLLLFLATGEGDRSGPADPPSAARPGPDRPTPTEGALDDLRVENQALTDHARRLEADLSDARADLDEARRRLESRPATVEREPDAATRIRRPGSADSPAAGGPGSAAGTREPAGEPGRMRMRRYVVLGEGLTAEAVEKLGLDETEKSQVESAIAQEEQRLHAALDLFARESQAIGDPKPGETTPALLTRLLHESGLTQQMMKFHEENPDAMQRMREGSISLRDILGEHSDAYRLLAAMREARRQTHQDVAGILDEDRAATFAGEIHPAGSYSFKGNLNLALMGALTPEEAAEAAAKREEAK